MEEIKETIATYEKIASNYFESHSDVSEIKEIVNFFLKNLKGKRVLDVGCGPGRDTRYFSEMGLKVVGMDLTRSFLRIGLKHAPKARFVLMDMQKLAFKEKVFDGIWACASFLHLPKKEAKNALFEFKRVLRGGGLLYISVKEGKGEHFIEKERYKGGKKFVAFYSKDEFEKLIGSCGFKLFRTLIERKGETTWINLFARKARAGI